MPELVILVNFASITGLVFLLGQRYIRLSRDPIRERLAGAATGTALVGEPLGGRGALLEGLAGALPRFKFDDGELTRDLRRAGYYKPSAQQEFLALLNGLVIFALILTGILTVSAGPQNSDWAIRILVIGTVIGTAIVTAR